MRTHGTNVAFNRYVCMESYRNLRGNSPILAYEIEPTYISSNIYGYETKRRDH